MSPRSSRNRVPWFSHDLRPPFRRATAPSGSWLRYLLHSAPTSTQTAARSRRLPNRTKGTTAPHAGCSLDCGLRRDVLCGRRNRESGTCGASIASGDPWASCCNRHVPRTGGGRRVSPDEAIDLGAGALVQAEGAIRLDATSARLLEQHFRIERDHDSAVLVGESSGDGTDPASYMLGRSTPMLGRERSLMLLESEWARCLEESQAWVVSRVAPAGRGKTRLLREFAQRVRQSRPDALVLKAFGDPAGGMAALGLVSQLVRDGVRVRVGDPPIIQRDNVTMRVRACLPAPDVDRVATFLGELIGSPFDHPNDLQLRAARHDPGLMASQVRRAFSDWLAAECRAHPVLISVEDLHWGDSASVDLIIDAMATAADLPLLVLASSRPMTDRTGHRSWPSSTVTMLPLGDLPKRACESIALAVLGADADRAVVTAVAERCAGNPFHLEELLRAVLEGHGQNLPGHHSRGVFQARLDALPADQRDLVCTASVYGRTAFLPMRSARDKRRLLEALCDCELLRPTRDFDLRGTD